MKVVEVGMEEEAETLGGEEGGIYINFRLIIVTRQGNGFIQSTILEPGTPLS
jgi:hypothetical protein